MKPMAKSRWSPASSKPANSLPVLNAARSPGESGTPLRIPGLLFMRLAIASFNVWTSDLPNYRTHPLRIRIRMTLTYHRGNLSEENQMTSSQRLRFVETTVAFSGCR
jgi:hypothetical protein